MVEFARYSDVKESIRKLDGTELMGKRIRLIDVSVSVFSLYISEEANLGDRMVEFSCCSQN